MGFSLLFSQVMSAWELFDSLDLDGDGALSRSDLRSAARELGWSWPEAPLYAVLDHLITLSAMSRRRFVEALDLIISDPLGPFGQVLKRDSPLRSAEAPLVGHHRTPPPVSADKVPGDTTDLLERLLGDEAAGEFAELTRGLGEVRLPARGSALLIIDPQRSFTSGVWMRSIGLGAAQEVAPIKLAFESCASLLRGGRGPEELMVTRCPFPPGSYGWDKRLRGSLGADQLYFIKPGNSALWPPTNGFFRWVEELPSQGRTALVMGGCTLNSCVRVTSIETRRALERSRRGRDLEVVVDLSLSGARTGNFVRSALYGDRSSVASAVGQMSAAGVKVVRRVIWT